MEERWKKHPDWPIQVSNLGRVRARWRGIGGWRIKTLSHKKQGVLCYNVCSVGGRGFPILRVSRLVLETFAGPCPDGLECRHLNGISTDDRRSNLTWGTREEQIADQKRHGTFSPPPVLRGKDNPSYRHGPEKYAKALYLVEAKGYSYRGAAAAMGISKTQLLRRKRAVEEVA